MTTQTDQGSWAGRYAGSLMNAFGPPKLVLERGDGAHVWDVDGTEYVDFLGGIAVNSLGHGHRALVEAVTRQLGTLGHVSNFFTSKPQVELAERLLSLWGVDGKVFFANSGTEAIEAAFKLTRLTGRRKVVVAEGSFHGRTMGALALTSKAAYREPFEPLPGGVVFVPYGDEVALADAVDEETAAVLLEPVQGEAGVMLPPPGYLAAAQRIAHQHGALFWLDEVQTGAGRSGRWFAHQADPALRPDLVTLAKGLAGGVPIGALLATGPAADLFQPGNHGTTFGGNPVASAAALAVLDTIESEGLLAHAEGIGARLESGLGTDARVDQVRRAGLLIGLDLDRDGAPDVVAAAQRLGFLLNAPGPATIRLAPPLNLEEADADALIARWPEILDVALAGEDS